MEGRLCCVIIFVFWHFLLVMDVFSLEDDDCGDLFITQTSNLDNNGSEKSGNKYPDKGFIQPVSLEF